MKPRNVIVSLLLVVALLALVFIKVRYWEPKKKLTFKRNPSRIEYSQFAMCRMGCYSLNANSITLVLQQGEVTGVKRKGNCSDFTLRMITKAGKFIYVEVQQCGTVARVKDCYDANAALSCDCSNRESPPLSFFKNKN